MVQKQLKRQIELNVQMHKYSLPMYCIQIYVEAFLIHYVPNRNYLSFCYKIFHKLHVLYIYNISIIWHFTTKVISVCNPVTARIKYQWGTLVQTAGGSEAWN